MTETEACNISETYFPDGLAVIAKRLEAVVIYCRLDGAEGWCVTSPQGGSIIRINQNSAVTRQKFTLAHELAHLILGSSPDILISEFEDYDPKNDFEKAADCLASKLLLPFGFVSDHFAGGIDRKTIDRAANKAEVSHEALANRLKDIGDSIGLSGSCVLKRSPSGGLKYYPRNWWLSEELCLSIFERGGSELTVTHRFSDGLAILAYRLGSPDYPIMFLHQIPIDSLESGAFRTRRAQLEDVLFNRKNGFRASFNGILSSFKSKCPGQSLVRLVEDFIETYSEHYKNEDGKMFHSAQGREYIELRLSEWC